MGKYVSQHGVAAAARSRARYFSSKHGESVSETTVRSIRNAYMYIEGMKRTRTVKLVEEQDEILPYPPKSVPGHTSHIAELPQQPLPSISIHDIGANSHLIKTGRGGARPVGAYTARCELHPLVGMQEWIRVRRDPCNNPLASLL